MDKGSVQSPKRSPRRKRDLPGKEVWKKKVPRQHPTHKTDALSELEETATPHDELIKILQEEIVQKDIMIRDIKAYAENQRMEALRIKANLAETTTHKDTEIREVGAYAENQRLEVLRIQASLVEVSKTKDIWLQDLLQRHEEQSKDYYHRLLDQDSRAKEAEARLLQSLQHKEAMIVDICDTLQCRETETLCLKEEVRELGKKLSEKDEVITGLEEQIRAKDELHRESLANFDTLDSLYRHVYKQEG
ncbi:hypothetical protein GQ53DRAFT_868310 [Thozetella sp. PMI_491]|nr:hypothetical protein GQ53DRAFT_868310 [Thozetella sp. PMI_491]